ncbi:MAG: CBS domain-containing protein, partial [Limisphaerales bacterium]
VTMTDLIRAQGGDGAGTAPIKQVMAANPVVVAKTDTCEVAANAIREYRLKTLPVVEDRDSRKLVGCLRVRRLMAFVMKETKAEKGPAQS